MNIQQLDITGLYGYMDKTISFKDSISILVGINGSGKTSVLNLINWLLKPDLRELCLIEFKRIELRFQLNGEDYSIVALQDDVELSLYITNRTKRKRYNKIQATFTIHPTKLTQNESLRDTLQGVYDGLVPDPDEREAWKFLFEEVPKPIVIGLDRNLYAEQGEELRVQTETRSHINRKAIRRAVAIGATPLEKVKQLLTREHNVYRNAVLQLYALLHEKIMLSSFDQIYTEANIDSLLKQSRPRVETIDKLRKQVTDFIRENISLQNKPASSAQIDTSVERIDKYFDALKSIVEADAKSDKKEKALLYITNISQFRKINSLIADFTQFEVANQKLYAPLKEFLDVVNGFLKDSSKEIYFDKSTSDIGFKVLARDESVLDTGRDIKYLSSGEKQILILLTYIKYNQNLNIFIIDEPELSLHPKWQADFIESVRRIMPPKSQLIVATHSPEIVGMNRDLCTVLLPYNK